MKCTGAKSRNGRRKSRPARISSRLSMGMPSHLLTAMISARPRSATMPNKARILLRHRVVRVDDADHDVRRVDGLQRLDDAELLDGFFDARTAAHAGGIDQRIASAVALERHEHRIARRAGLIERDQPLLAQQPIDQRRLADVRPADHGDANVVGTRRTSPSSACSRPSSTSSINERTPSPCADEMACGSPRPS